MWSSPVWSDATDLVPRTAVMSGAFIDLCIFQTGLSAANATCSATEPLCETFLDKRFHFKKFICWVNFRYISKLLGMYPKHQTHLSLWQSNDGVKYNHL